MDKLRRLKQITDNEINQFKESEIEIVLNEVKPHKQENKKNARSIILSIVLVTILLLTTFIILENAFQKPTYHIQQLSSNEFLLESVSDDESFQLYYKANVVKLGERTSYDNTFDYQVNYEYVDNQTMDLYDISFNAFKLNKYRYFLEVSINGDTEYIEIDYFNYHSFEIELIGLEIDDLETDISELFDLMNTYPPIDRDGYLQVNPYVTTSQDSKVKRNYITYINNYYIDEDLYQYVYRSDKLSITEHHVIVVDDNGDKVSSHFDFTYAFGDINHQELIHELSDFNENFFFYAKNQTNKIYGFQNDLYLLDNSIEGYYRTIPLNDNYYFYSVIDITDLTSVLENTDHIHFSYTLTDINNDQTNSITTSPMFYNQALIIPPMNIGNITYSNTLYNSFTIDFYDSNNELIYQIIK